MESARLAVTRKKSYRIYKACDRTASEERVSRRRGIDAVDPIVGLAVCRPAARARAASSRGSVPGTSITETNPATIGTAIAIADEAVAAWPRALRVGRAPCERRSAALRVSGGRQLEARRAIGRGHRVRGPGPARTEPGAHEGSGGVRPRARDADLPRADDRRRARVDGWTPRARVARRLRPVTAPRRTALPAVVRPIGRPPRRRRTPAPRRGLPPRHRLAGSGTASSSPRRADQTSRSSLNTRQSLSESNCRRSTNSNPSRR